MRLASPLRFVGSAMVGIVALGIVAASAAGYPLRSPQVPLQTGWDNISLQSYLNSIGENTNTLTQQLDLQYWQTINGASDFTLVMEIAGYASHNDIGIYNANEATPSMFLVFPGGAGPGWSATCAFTTGGHLHVNLYDQAHVFQGSTNYSGVNQADFGFYLSGPGGTFYSQDARNPGGKPQVLTYAGTGPYAGRWWECFEDLPYASSDLDYQDSILLLDSLAPTPTRELTWGALKLLYR